MNGPPPGAIVKLTCPICGEVQYWTRDDVDKMTEIIARMQNGEQLLPRHMPCGVFMRAYLLPPRKEQEQ